MVLAASGILLKGKKILLLQRSNYTLNFPGYWGCPGGKAEPSETAIQNVIREVKEECNLDFVPTEIIKTGINIMPSIKNKIVFIPPNTLLL